MPETATLSNQGTFGPAYERKRDGARIATQMAVIRHFMLAREDWLTLAEIETALGYPQASISAQLRHLRKPEFGSHTVNKRRREPEGGTWEYKVTL